VSISLKFALNQFEVEFRKRENLRELSVLQFVLIKEDFAFPIDNVSICIDQVAFLINQVPTQVLVKQLVILFKSKLLNLELLIEFECAHDFKNREFSSTPVVERLQASIT
jgi:hypothetical protein